MLKFIGRLATVLLMVVGGIIGLGGCSLHRAPGRGAQACPYVRPRLIRVDRDVLQSSSADLSAVAQDFALYVSQLPAGGKAKADVPLVRFATALRTASGPDPDPASLTTLSQAEAALKRLCNVTA